MNQQELTERLSDKIKLARVEQGYTQEKMAAVLGLSKKTLVQIEKGRSAPSWTCIVAFCALFRGSEVLQSTMGGDPLEVVEAVSKLSMAKPLDRTWGGKLWWSDLERQGDYRLQQNVISQHYRILDGSDRRWFSTFDREEAVNRLQQLAKSEHGRFSGPSPARED